MAHLRLLIDLRERGVHKRDVVLGDGGVRHGGGGQTDSQGSDKQAKVSVCVEIAAGQPAQS